MSKNEKAFGRILALLNNQLGVDLTLYKSATLRRRMDRRVVALRLNSLVEYFGYLRKHAHELNRLFNDLLIQVTGFFRDAFVFDLLKSRYLPRLLNEKKRENLRVWVPACSTGEEVYSLAILCAEVKAEKKLEKLQIQIFGTDINEAVLEKARAGFYPEAALKQVTPERRARFFERVKNGYRIRKDLRDLCIFARHDVTADPPFSNVDLISCRNVLIYLTPPLQQRLLPLFQYAIRHTGILMLGSSETIGRFTDQFSLENKKAKIYMKKQGAAKASSAVGKFKPAPSQPLPAPAPRAAAGSKSAPAPVPTGSEWQATINQAIRENIGTGAAANVVPLNMPQSAEKIYLVFVDPKTATHAGKKPVTGKKGEANTENTHLRQELSAARRSIQSILEQGNVTTEKLRAANEEIISSNEELQSTNEELETAKEELQSANEELTALNHELENRNQELERAASISRHFTAIVESSDDAVISKTLDGIIQTWNRGAEKIFGYTAEEVIGKSITILIPEDHHNEEPTILSRLRQGERVQHYETIRKRKDGKLIHISLTISPIKNNAGVIVGASKIARDVTDRKRIETDLELARDQAERANRTKDEFLAALSHELRTPLNPVLLLASDAAANPDLPAHLRASFELIRQNVEVEVRLIDDLLDLTRITTGKLILEKQEVVILDLLKDTVNMVRADAEQKQIVLKEKYGEAGAHVFGDTVRLRQIFWNVLKNAIKFTASAGTITVETHATRKEFKVVVSDTGVGMTKQELERAFQAFRFGSSEEAQRLGGLGLGLTIGKRLVELHDGSISATSDGRNYGSTITITLPVTNWKRAVVKKPKPAAPVAEAKVTLPAWKVLLVEDHQATREALTSLLTRRHLKVTPAGSVAEAVALAAQEEFDVVISDIGLPDGNGNDLFTKLRRQSPDIKGIALTGYGMEGDVGRSKNVGFHTHLTKPVGIQSLEAALKQLVK